MQKHSTPRQRKTKTTQLRTKLFERISFWKILTPQTRIKRVETKIFKVKSDIRKLESWKKKDQSSLKRKSGKGKQIVEAEIDDFEKALTELKAVLRKEETKLAGLKQKFNL